MLTVEQTTRSYTGKPACMCGCNGTYNDSERARKMAITALLKNPKAMTVGARARVRCLL